MSVPLSSRVDLVLSSARLSPEDISARLGILPDSFIRMGDAIGERRVTRHICEYTAPWPDRQSALDDILLQLIVRIGSANAIIASLVAGGIVWAGIRPVVWHMPLPDLTLTAGHVAWIASLGAAFDLCINSV